MTMRNLIYTAPFIQEMIEATSNLYRLGWDERNGGNISYLLNHYEVLPYLDVNKVIRSVPMNFDASGLAGRYFAVTGSGKYFKNVKEDPAANLGVIQIAEDGKSYEILWGLDDGAIATSELPTHLMNHMKRLAVAKNHRVFMHCHATHLIAMTFSHSLKEEEFTKTLWEMCTECIVVFPDGVGVIPWIIPGTNEIGAATAEKMEQVRLVIWPHHGIFGAGATMDETFGLIETAEKAAQVYTIVCSLGGKKQTISDQQLKDLADAFHVVPRAGVLKF